MIEQKKTNTFISVACLLENFKFNSNVLMLLNR